MRHMPRCGCETLEPRRLFSAAAVPRPDHLVIVVEENHSYGQVIGSADAPYLNAGAEGRT